MRSAMLNRRIAKEKKRKQEDDARKKEEEAARRKKMTGKLAKGFKKLIDLKAKEANLEIAEKENRQAAQDRLRARLAAWKRTADEAKRQRRIQEGESEIWEVEEVHRREKEEELERKRQAEEDKIRKEQNYEKNVKELFKRIKKVELLT